MSDKDDTQMEGQLTIEFLDYARFDKCIRSKCLTHSQVGDFVVIEKSDGDNYTEAIFAVAERIANKEDRDIESVISELRTQQEMVEPLL